MQQQDRKGIRAHVASAEIAEFYLGCPIRQPPDLPEQPDLAFFGPLKPSWAMQDRGLRAFLLAQGVQFPA